jgi:hypothetical protein
MDRRLGLAAAELLHNYQGIHLDNRLEVVGIDQVVDKLLDMLDMLLDKALNKVPLDNRQHQDKLLDKLVI